MKRIFEENRIDKIRDGKKMRKLWKLWAQRILINDNDDIEIIDNLNAKQLKLEIKKIG